MLYIKESTQYIKGTIYKTNITKHICLRKRLIELFHLELIAFLKTHPSPRNIIKTITHSSHSIQVFENYPLVRPAAPASHLPRGISKATTTLFAAEAKRQTEPNGH